MWRKVSVLILNAINWNERIYNSDAQRTGFNHFRHSSETARVSKRYPVPLLVMTPYDFCYPNQPIIRKQSVELFIRRNNSSLVNLGYYLIVYAVVVLLFCISYSYLLSYSSATVSIGVARWIINVVLSSRQSWKTTRTNWASGQLEPSCPVQTNSSWGKQVNLLSWPNDFLWWKAWLCGNVMHVLLC